MKKQIQLPEFKNSEEEKAYWTKFDLSEFADAKDLVDVAFTNLRPTSKPISIRLPESMINRLKEKANEISVPYQALIKLYIKDGLSK